MNAYVAVTDLDWYDFLAAQRGIDEVNFWQPRPWGGEFGVLRRGEPLLFKLKAPRNVIAGVGFFEGYLEFPLSRAWDMFGIKNGAPDRQSMWQRLARLRRDNPPWFEDFDVGCIMLVEPCFFPRDLWIAQPRSFSSNIVRGSRFDLTTTEGAALWARVVEAMQATCGPASITGRGIDPASVEGDAEVFGGYGEPVPVRRRLGQGTFAALVTQAYGRSCAITRERALPALEAAHIKPFSEVAGHMVRNGLLLRSDVHKLFDAGYLTVTPEFRVEASDRMRDDFNDGENYKRLHGTSIILPGREDERPSPDFLRWHNENRYRG